MQRPDGRRPDEMRAVRLEPDYLKHPEGSVLITVGDTRVICTASVEDRVPQFLKDGGQGWVTSEYGMLPRATDVRTQREASRGQVSGRSQEIQRLIGRALRGAVDRRALGERTIWMDCDVIQADGGTRTASITGAFVALALAVHKLMEQGKIKQPPVLHQVAAVSVGVVAGTPVLDLCYEEDSAADTDMNVVLTEGGGFLEVQGTAEHAPFARPALDALLDLADGGARALFALQRDVLGARLAKIRVPPLGGSR